MVAPQKSARLRTTRRRRVWCGAIAATVIAVALSAGTAAYSYWTGSGSGGGTATAGTTVALTLTSGTATSSLFPGGRANVELTASNSNTLPVRIMSLALDTTRGPNGFTVSGSVSGCSLTFDPQTNGGAGWSVPAKTSGDGTATITLANAVSMGVDAASACQGKTVMVYLVADK